MPEPHRFVKFVPVTECVLAARQDVRGAAAILGFSETDIPILAAAGLLPPLAHGKIGRNSVKYWATVRLLELAQDERFLAQATRICYEARFRRNHKKEVPRNGVRPEPEPRQAA